MCALMGGSRTLHYFAHTDEAMGLFEWVLENSGGHPHPVGTLRPNRLGLHDMLGNLAEWCSPPRPLDPQKPARMPQ